jgi:DNA-binding NarL/FixJ family response regulator
MALTPAPYRKPQRTSLAMPSAARTVIDRTSQPYVRSRQSGVSDRRPAYRGHLRLLARADDRDPGSIAGADRVDGRSSAGGQTPSPVRVLLAHGQGLARARYRALLESCQRITVVGEAASSRQALALATSARPDVALLDEGLPGLDDLETAAAVVAQPAFAHVAVALLMSSTEDERVLAAVRAGFVGVLQKDAETAALIGSLQLLASGHAVLPTATIASLLGDRDPQSLQHPVVTTRGKRIRLSEPSVAEA